MFRRNRLAMLVAEFLGTGVLTLAVLSVQRSQLGLAYFVALAAGLAVALLTYVFGAASGAQFNPALTLALWTARRIKTVPAILYIVVQLLGAWAAYALYHYFVHTSVQAVTQSFSGRIMVAEAIGTLVFALAWAAAAYNRYETGRFAAVAGLGFAVAILIASAGSIGVANPALALGVRAWEVFGQNGWGNYVLGPVLGAVIGVNLFGLLFADPERPFGALRGNRAATDVATASTSGAAVVSPVDATDDTVDEDEEEASFSRSSVRKTKTVAATPAGATKAARVKKTSVKKVPAKSSRRKR